MKQREIADVADKSFRERSGKSGVSIRICIGGFGKCSCAFVLYVQLNIKRVENRLIKSEFRVSANWRTIYK